jgi:hypothetical protein
MRRNAAGSVKLQKPRMQYENVHKINWIEESAREKEAKSSRARDK